MPASNFPLKIAVAHSRTSNLASSPFRAANLAVV